jgi:phosphoribosyl 1,2-cyclic phosphodiesterase
VLRVTVLGSGSRGNAVLIDGSDGSLLVDAGFGLRALRNRLQMTGRHPEEIQGLVLTHEHVDHASGAAAASARWGWPVYATADTLTALAASDSGAPALSQRLAPSGPTPISGFALEHCAVPHDAADCRALLLTDTRSGARLGVVLDAGHVPDALPAFLSRLDLLVLESNHDADMLANGPYPWMLKRRISGGSGHLSNVAAAALAARCVHRGLRGVVLAHLSETNNTPDLALACLRDTLRRAGWRRDALWAAAQRQPHAPVTAAGTTTPVAAIQLSLF